MKAFLRVELFCEDARQFCKIVEIICKVNLGDQLGKAYFDEAFGMPSRSSWVAKVTGPDETYGLHREFLRAKIDYSQSNSKGSRGIFAEYILEQGKIYEVKAQVSWSRAERYFCTVNDCGDIVEISEEEACHRIGALTKEERREKRIAERIYRDQRP